MFETIKHVFLCIAVILLNSKTCTTEAIQPSLVLYSPGDLEYTDVLVRRVGDNLTLVCELRGDSTPRVYVWNYVSDNGTSVGRPFAVDPTSGPSPNSKLERSALQISDSGHYMCSAPPFSVTKYILVQPPSPTACARGAFWCGVRCVLAGYVCDGRRDCLRAEDEAPSLCAANPCSRSGKLNCSSGRCISEAACCQPGDALCRQHACCAEYKKYARVEVGGYVEPDLPPLFEDRHAPDDYGFIQSTIYTVTACALIFMIAVVLLVSALCKMHMKRAALRDYATARRATAHHYSQLFQARYPPRYEATRLLEPTAALSSPVRQPLQTCTPDSPQDSTPGTEIPDVGTPDCPNSGFGLARLSAIFSSRYRQVPTQCCDVEMTDVRPTSLTNTPTRSRTLDNYRSPTYCDLNFFTNPDISTCGRDLNYMGTPVEFFRRRAMRRNTLDRVMGHLTQAQPLTLQLGRFQFSLPRFGRRSEEPRPDTPNVAEINIDDLDFVRLNSNETYTLNGRTIRLLGANFENYPVLSDTQVRPPPYTEAMRYKVYGPPPEYLSREGLNRDISSPNVDEEARNNVEMPPNYEDLASGVDVNANATNDVTTNNVTANGIDVIDVNDNVPESISSVIDNLPAIDSDFNANDTTMRFDVNVHDVNNVRM
ncbi:uncharacterized protein [Epargyreus clarus]|uniref:uncharacterized protein n=1 Tax=Epargyreus clarus TaxID=520877 RepID=UPI003C2F725B